MRVILLCYVIAYLKTGSSFMLTSPLLTCPNYNGQIFLGYSKFISLVNNGLTGGSGASIVVYALLSALIGLLVIILLSALIL